MRNRRIEVMCNVCCTNFVVKEVNGTPRIKFVIRTINCVEGTLDEVVVTISKMWNIYICVLEPVIDTCK